MVYWRCASRGPAGGDRPRAPATGFRCRGRRDRSRLRSPLSQRTPSLGRGGSMTLALEHRQVNAIRQHGEADYPAEACGLIGGTVEDGRKVAVLLVPLVNRRTDSARNRYLIEPAPFSLAQAKPAQDRLSVSGV